METEVLPTAQDVAARASEIILAAARSAIEQRGAFSLVLAGGSTPADCYTLLAAAQAGLEVHEYSPSAVKKAIVGVGTAPKAQVQEIVARRLGLERSPSPADAADALAVAMCHLQSAPLQRAIREAGA